MSPLPGTARERALTPSIFDWGVTYAWASVDTMKHADLVDRAPSKEQAVKDAAEVRDAFRQTGPNAWAVQVVVRAPGGQWVTQIGTPVAEFHQQVRAYAEGRSTKIPG